MFPSALVVCQQWGREVLAMKKLILWDFAFSIFSGFFFFLAAMSGRCWAFLRPKDTPIIFSAEKSRPAVEIMTESNVGQ